jgi:rhamnosyltransferase
MTTDYMGNVIKIAGTVILYNPHQNFIENILLYLHDIERLYVIDNSDQFPQDYKSRLSHNDKIVYLDNKSNIGIAAALNIAAHLAIRDGYEFLLTMDQDSKVTPGMIKAMLKCLDSVDLSRVGILSPVQVYTSYKKISYDKPCEEILTTMTSGSLLNLTAYRVTGPFLDKLFIDYIDHEYCMRLKTNGFKTVQANNAVLEHPLGSITEYRLLWKRFALGNHPPLRRYYITRNKFYLYDHYKKIFPDYFRHFFTYLAYEILTILLYENNKVYKLRMIVKGYLHNRHGVYGKYSSD